MSTSGVSPSTPNGAEQQDASFGQRMQRIEVLVREMEALADPAARAGAVELVQAILELHGAGLARILAVIEQSGEAGPAISERLLHDDLVSSLLLLHDLHPLDPETRVRRALERLRPHLSVQGGHAELVGLSGGIARVRMVGDLEQAVREAILAAAPEVVEMVIEGRQNGRAGTFIPLSALTNGHAHV